MDIVASDMLINEMAINFYVLGAFMKNIIMGDLDSTSIVTLENG